MNQSGCLAEENDTPVLEHNTMELHELRVPSVSEYAAALRAVESKMTPKQREMLLTHHASPAHVTSATRLAEAVGFESYKAVNLQYGLLAADIARALNIELPKRVALGILVEFVDPQFAGNEHWLWVLRPNVAEALESLGWVPLLSHLLYPKALETTSQ